MIQSSYDQYYNCQPQMRQIPLLNKNSNIYKRLSGSQKPGYYFQQYGQEYGQYVYNQQAIDLNLQTQQSKSLIMPKHQQFNQKIGKVSHQQQNSFSKLDQLSNRSSTNQASAQNIGQSVNLQQYQKQILKQSNYNQSQQKSDVYASRSNYINTSDQTFQEIKQASNVLGYSQQDQRSLQANRDQQQAPIENKIQPINRLTSLYVNDNLKNDSLDSFSKENTGLINCDNKIKCSQNKSCSPSLNEENENKQSNSTQQINDNLLNNVNNQLLNQQDIRQLYYSQSTKNMKIQQNEQQSGFNQDFLINKQQHYNIINQDQFNLPNPNEILNFQTLLKTPQYQNLTSISNSPSTTNNNQEINQDQKQNQLVTNPFSHISDQLISSKQNFIKSKSELDKNKDQFSKIQSNPYDLLNTKFQDYINVNKQQQNYQLQQKDNVSIPEENAMTPKKQQVLNSSEQSQRSLTKALDTADTETHEKYFSFQKYSISNEQNQPSPHFKHTEYLHDFESPIFKLKVRERTYGNEDLCNYYPVSHISAEDLSKYDIVIKCTTQIQNQNAINQKVKDFYDGFELSAQ